MVWVGGNWFGAASGTAQRKYLDSVKTEYEQKYPGSTVTYVLMPEEYGQFYAKLTAAFASGAVPDLILMYTGGWMTPFLESGVFQNLSGYVKSTPGFYDSITQWDNSCKGLDCKSGSGEIYGIPHDQYGRTYGLFYNKSLIEKAGISALPTTYEQLIADCGKLNAVGVTPISIGNKEGIGPDEWITNDYASYINAATGRAIANHKASWNNPQFVAALQQFTGLVKAKCFNADMNTRAWVDSHTIFEAGKAAMTLENPTFTGEFKKALGSKLAVAPTPNSGPDNGATLAGGVDNWVIPAKAGNKAGGWTFIKVATATTSQSRMVTETGTIPANAAALKAITDPLAKYFVEPPANPNKIPIMDVIPPVKDIFIYYKNLQGGAALRVSPASAMAAVQQQISTVNP
jgi:ABC-type glycerol-3-phosphate transport system substrate-binding protein